MSLDAQNLQCFIEAARLLNFTTAARAVALSPAAFGQRIAALEEDLNVPLFHRTTRTVVLTQAGLDLVPQARKALQAMEECRQVGSGNLEPAPMELVLGTRHELGLSWIVPTLDRLEKQRRGMTLHLYFGSGPDLLTRVRRLEIDCAVTSTRLIDPMLESEPLHEERYTFVGARSLLNCTPFKKAEHAAAHTLFDTTEDLPLFRYFRETQGAFDSSRFNKVMRMGTIDAIRALVLRGRGVAVLPEYFVAPDLRRGRLVRILPRIKPHPDHFRLIFRKDDPRRIVYTAIADTLRAVPLK